MTNVYQRASLVNESDELLDELTKMRQRTESYINTLQAMTEYYIEKKKIDADRVQDGNLPIFTDEEWTITDQYVDNLINGYDILDDNGNVIGHQAGLNDLIALALTSKGSQTPHEVVVEDPPAEDPPAEDPPAEDPPAEDPVV